MTTPWAGSALPILLGFAASTATLGGGVIALRLGRHLQLLLGLTAGIVIGVALFDLLPEAMTVALGVHDMRTILAATACGFAAYLVIDRLAPPRGARGMLRAHLGPATLTLHSFFDGMGIGLAFQVSTAVGGMIAFAVLAHDLSDGVNTVSLCLAGSRRKDAPRWLAANAIAPLAGVVFAYFVRVPAPVLALLLAVFAGIFLYIGTCELLPRSIGTNPRPRAMLATLCGLAIMYAAVNLAS